MAGATLSDEIGIPALVMGLRRSTDCRAARLLLAPPELRSELADGAVLDRLDSGALEQG